MIGSGFGSLAGGAISENMGGSYELGATIGNIVGGVAGSVTYSKIVSMKNISATKAPNNECHPNCFIAGTLVATSGGYKAIEEIQAGDMVLAENPETGEIALKRVVQTFENESDELVHVFVNGEEIKLQLAKSMMSTRHGVRTTTAAIRKGRPSGVPNLQRSSEVSFPSI